MKKKILSIFILLLFLSFPLFAFAGFAEFCQCLVIDIACILRCIVEYLLSLPIRVLVAAIIIVFAIIGFAGIILAWIGELIAGLLIYFSLQHAYEPTFYQIWREVRNVALWFIAVFLAFIGIATILRIESYGAKKAFFPLLFVAFFINFLPWITRTIIHIGNSLSYYFFFRLGVLRNPQNPDFGIIGRNPLTKIKEYVQDLGEALYTVFTIDGRFIEKFFSVYGGEGPYILILGLIVVGQAFTAIFWIMYAFLIFGVAIYFLVRTAYLWILFIISPLPFVTLPFAHTREIKTAFPGPLNWEGWFQQLLHWSFIGVPIAFFVMIAGYLANSPQIEQRLKNASQFVPVTNEFQSQGLSGAHARVSTTFQNMLAETIRYAPALVALSIGLSISPGLMGSGVQRFWSVGKALATGAVVGGALAGGGLVRRFGRRIAAPVIKRIPEPVRQRVRTRLDEAKMRMAPYTEYVKGKLKGLPGVSEFERERAQMLEAKLKNYEKLSSEYLNKQLETKADVLSLEEKVKILEILVQRGDLTQRALQKLFSGKNLEELNKVYGEKLVRQIITQNPHWAAGTIINPKTGQAFTLGEVMSTFSADEIKNLSSDALSNPEILGYILQDREMANRLGGLSQKKRKVVRQNATLAYTFAFDNLAASLNKEWGTSITGAEIKRAVEQNDWRELSQQLSPSQLKELQQRAGVIVAQRDRIYRDPRFYV